MTQTREKINFCKFILSRDNRLLTDGRGIGFCYNKESKNDLIYNDLYFLRFNYKVDFSISIYELKKKDFCIYLEADQGHKINKILALYKQYAKSKNLRIEDRDCGDYGNEFYIEVNGELLNVLTKYESDKACINFFAVLDLPIDLYLAVLDNVDIFQFETLKLCEVNYTVNEIPEFQARYKGYYTRQEFLDLTI